MSGFLISFEGLDGSGKTTVIDVVAERITEEYGLDLILLREPGTTNVGKEIREIVHNPVNVSLNSVAELFLYMASRAQLVAEVIKPRLEEGSVVVMDRFVDSSAAYQGAGRELGVEFVNSLNKLATGGIVPDLTILLDIPVSVKGERLRDGREFNRMDAQDIEFYQRVRDQYLLMAEKNEDSRWVKIDATRTIDEVVEDSLKVIVEKLKLAGFIERERASRERRP